MSNNIVVQYVGFEVTPVMREYTFTVREAGESRDFTLSIANEAFVAHKVRFQDGPGICALRLRTELDAVASHPLEAHYKITNTELDAYSASQLPKTARRTHKVNSEQSY